MKVYTVLTIVSFDQTNSLDVAKTAYMSPEAARAGLEDHEEVQPGLFEKQGEDGSLHTVLVVEQTVEGTENA